MIEKTKRALFLDRDGTINVDPGYLSKPDLLELLPGAAEAIRKARDHGFFIAVISNQSGVARGLISPEALSDIHRRLNELLQERAGAWIDHFACCTHHPSDGCDCRKPLPRLVLDTQAMFGLDLSRSAFIGDRLTDIRTGRAAPVRYSVLVRTGQGQDEEKKLTPKDRVDFIAENLFEAVNWVLTN